MKQNLTCWCDSPLIEYTGSWTPRPVEDPSSLDIDPSISMESNRQGDMAAFNFTGTAVWIWPGSDKPHGSYDVYLDGTPSRFNASNAATNQTIPLFKATGLPSIPHTLSIHNTGSQDVSSSNDTSLLNIYALTWEMRDRYGNATSMGVSSLEDEWGDFSFHPFDYWMTETSSFLDGLRNLTITTHTTNSSGSWMQYNFTGSDTVSIFGNVGPKHGAYSVKLEYVEDDDTTEPPSDNDDHFDLPGKQIFNASFPYNRTRVLLFHASNINSSRKAMLTMENIPAKLGDSLTIDYATHLRFYYGDHQRPRSRTLSAGALAGIIVSGLVSLGLILLGMYFLRKRRQGKLIRRQKLNLFKGLLIKRGVLRSQEDHTKKGDLDQSTDMDTSNNFGATVPNAKA